MANIVRLVVAGGGGSVDWLGGWWCVWRMRSMGCGGESGGSCGGRGGEPINISRESLHPSVQRRPRRGRPTSGSGDAVVPHPPATGRDEVLLTLLTAFLHFPNNLRS